jgi:hypothetical protein
MDYFNKNREELIDICKKKGIKGYSRKNKRQLIEMIQEKETTMILEKNVEEETIAPSEISDSVHNMLVGIIEKQKQKEEKLDIWKNSPFRDLTKLQSNNVGNIGEELINTICKSTNIISECDGSKTKQIGGGQGDGKIMGISVEIKTAHQGCKNQSFQHELGEVPWKGAKYMIFVDISPECLYLTIFENFDETTYKSKQKLNCFPTKTITWRKKVGAFKLDTSVKINEQSIKNGYAIKIVPMTTKEYVGSFIKKIISQSINSIQTIPGGTKRSPLGSWGELALPIASLSRRDVVPPSIALPGLEGTEPPRSPDPTGRAPKKKEKNIKLMIENSKKQTEPPTTPDEKNLNLLEECLEKNTIKNVACILNLSIGTIKRWIELKDVPIQYTFDLYKILSKDIDYSKYSSSLKDQFFTPKDVAERCWTTFIEQVKINTADYTFIEPSAGDGSFLKILPKGSIGLDIEPRSAGIYKQDYLTWEPTDNRGDTNPKGVGERSDKDTSKKYIVFGNPPFGLRGHIALNFINYSYKFADYVCFILPQLFESDGKGSPRKRVKGYNLVYSENLSAIFYSPENKDVKVNGVFQIWSKYSSNPNYNIKTNSEKDMKVYSLSDGGTVSSTRNKDMIGKCDIYLPSTCFGKDNMKIYKSFYDLPGKKGYGIVFFTNKKEMIQKALNIDWSSISFLSTNSAYNLRTSIIFSQFSF